MKVFSKLYCDRVYFLCAERFETGSGFEPPQRHPPTQLRGECPPPPPSHLPSPHPPSHGTTMGIVKKYLYSSLMYNFCLQCDEKRSVSQNARHLALIFSYSLLSDPEFSGGGGGQNFFLHAAHITNVKREVP